MHKGRFIIYVQGGEGKKKGGFKAVLDWLGGGADFFKQSIGGNLFFQLLQGILSVLLQMRLLLRNKLISKIRVVKMENPVRRILS